MAQPVWVLSVDLQTKTATFQSGMADAAKAARGSFNDIKQGAGEMARDTSVNMMEARHGVMLLGEEFGIHLPRALTSFIVSLGPIGAAMEAAFPFLAIIVGATLLIEHLQKVKEEGEKLTESQVQFGITVANVLNALDEKLMQAGIRTDELNGNHLAALEKQLQLIDHQSLKELEKSFDELAKSADATFAQLKAHIYEFGSGSEGARASLTKFKQEYDALLAKHDDKGATQLLDEKIKREERILELQKQAQALDPKTGKNANGADYNAITAAHVELKKLGVGWTDKEVQAEQTLVDTLHAQSEAVQKVADLKKAEQDNARQTTGNEIDADADKVFRVQQQDRQKAQEEQDKREEKSYRDAVDRIQQGEREKVKATKEGTAERLAAIDAAIKEENAKGLQEEGYYKELLGQRVDTARQMSEEEAKLKADAGKEAAEHTEKMGELEIAAEREKGNTRLQQAIMTGQEKLQAELQLANEEYQLKQKALNDEIAALDQHAQDYQNKKKALEDREEELERAHQNRLQQIQDQAAQQQYSKLNSSMIHMEGEFAKGFTSVLMRHQSFANMMNSLGSQVVSGMMEEAIKSALAMDFGKEKEAAAAARKFFLAGAKFPFPANIVMAPAMGALAFASMMAFQEGGLVPGVGTGDIVNAKLEPGETVLPKKMTENLSRATDSDSGKSGPVHVHFRPTYHVNTIDGDGIRQTLTKHAGEFQKHVEHTLRKMNR